MPNSKYDSFYGKSVAEMYEPLYMQAMALSRDLMDRKVPNDINKTKENKMLKAKHGEYIRSVTLTKSDWEKAKELGDRYQPRISRQQAIKLAVTKGLIWMESQIKKQK